MALSKSTNVGRGAKFYQLKSYLYLEKDKNEFYRAMSRIGNADSLSYDTKYPIILNRDHRLTEFSVWDTHNSIKHLVEWQTLAENCSCYWILRVKSFVKKILHRCLICRKFNSRSCSHPNSPNVPDIRVNDDTTFFLDQS